jgi:hypothetical protein
MYLHLNISKELFPVSLVLKFFPSWSQFTTTLFIRRILLCNFCEFLSHCSCLKNQFAAMLLPSRFFFIDRYLATLNGSFYCWLAFGAPLLPNSMTSYYHKYVAYIGVMACHYSFHIACGEGPGVLTAENVDCFDHQKYDGVLYIERRICRTCQIRKASKYKLRNLTCELFLRIWTVHFVMFP